MNSPALQAGRFKDARRNETVKPIEFQRQALRVRGQGLRGHVALPISTIDPATPSAPPWAATGLNFSRLVRCLRLLVAEILAPSSFRIRRQHVSPPRDQRSSRPLL